MITSKKHSRSSPSSKSLSVYKKFARVKSIGAQLPQPRFIKPPYPQKVELKRYIDHYASEISTSNGVDCLNYIRLGSDSNQRIGRGVRLININIEGVLEPWSGTTLPAIANIALVYDRQSNGQTALYTGSSSGVFSVNEVNSMPEPTTITRFTILRRLMIPLAQGGSINADNKKHFSMSVKFPTWFTEEFSGDSSDYTEITKGALWLVYKGDGSIYGNGHKLDYRYSIGFVDN